MPFLATLAVSRRPYGIFEVPEIAPLAYEPQEIMTTPAQLLGLPVNLLRRVDCVCFAPGIFFGCGVVGCGFKRPGTLRGP